MAFIPYCSLPELEACMEVWGFMEMIHSRSYTLILSRMFTLIQEKYLIIFLMMIRLSRATSVTEAYDDFINSAQQYGTSNDWIHAQEGAGYFKEEPY
jgi:ribonucleotide reductase beta subunit family protein with ferritin-like domain